MRDNQVEGGVRLPGRGRLAKGERHARFVAEVSLAMSTNTGDGSIPTSLAGLDVCMMSFVARRCRNQSRARGRPGQQSFM